jgi:hypothetical protein
VALNLGGIIRLTYAVKNDLGVLANPATATVTITQPDGTTASPTVVLPPTVTGQLVVDFTSVQAGLHSVHWATTAPVTSEDDVFVAEAPARMLVSVDEAVSHLRAGGVITSDADREQLQWLCLVATDAVEHDLGRVLVRRTIVETYEGAGGAISLRSTPVISITSVVEAGTTLTINDYLLNVSQGVLLRGTSLSSQSWAYGRQNIVVTYVAGYARPPAIARKVALNAVQAMWQTSQQASHPLINEDVAPEFISASVEGLTPLEMRAYDRLRAHGVA